TVGWNSRLDEVQAAVLRVKLGRLARWTELRSAAASRYDAMLEDAGLVARGLVVPPVRRPGRTHVFHQYVVRIPGAKGGDPRGALREHLASRGIATGIYYPLPLHLQPCFRYLGYAAGDFPVSEQAAKEVLALPIYPELGPDLQALVVQGISGCFG